MDIDLRPDKENYYVIQVYGVQENEMKHSRSNSGISEILLGENQKDQKKSIIKAEDTEHMKYFNDCFDIIAYTRFAMGIIFTYRWRFWGHLMHVFSTLLLATVWITVSYTMVDHYRNGDYLRISEPLSIASIMLSVRLKIQNHRITHTLEIF